MDPGGLIAFAVGVGIGIIFGIIEVIRETSKEINLMNSVVIDKIDVKTYTQSCIEWCSENLGGYPPVLKYSRAKPINAEKQKKLYLEPMTSI